MKIYLWIAVGSALGGMARHWVTTFAAIHTGKAFPWGTLAVNLTGSFLIGLIAALPSSYLSNDARSFLTVGIMGGFTTFSAFSLQTVTLFQGASVASALGYVGLSVLGCPLLAWLGWTLAHRPA